MLSEITVNSLAGLEDDDVWHNEIGKSISGSSFRS
jgi:hypothetical protein